MCTEKRFTPVADIPAGLQRAWSSRKQFIDLVEQAAGVVAITLMPQLCYEKDVLWFIDSSVALIGLTRCANSGAELDKECAVILLLLSAVASGRLLGVCSV